MPDRVKIVAVGLLTEDDLARLGTDFRRTFPVADLARHDGLLQALALADESYHAHEQERFVSNKLKS